MTFEDEFTVHAPVEKVWAFLRDPDQVARCMPGTERVEPIDDTHYRVVAGAKVSFLSLTFTLNVALTAIEAPRRLVSIAEGMDDRLKERVKLVSELTLEPGGAGETVVRYRIDLTVYGKLASMGFAVIKGKAKQMAADFATGIRTRLEAEA